MFALSMFLLVMSRRINPKKPKDVRHYFSSQAPEGHVPDESEIPYWVMQLPEHY